MDAGPQAFKELRSPGRKVVWICQMGREAVDGDFGSFQEKILALPVQFNELSLRLTNLMGDEITFGFTQDFLVNGDEVSMRGFPHYENPYSSTGLDSEVMDIVYGDSVLRLDFSLPSES